MNLVAEVERGNQVKEFVTPLWSLPADWTVKPTYLKGENKKNRKSKWKYTVGQTVAATTCRK